MLYFTTVKNKYFKFKNYLLCDAGAGAGQTLPISRVSQRDTAGLEEGEKTCFFIFLLFSFSGGLPAPMSIIQQCSFTSQQQFLLWHQSATPSQGSRFAPWGTSPNCRAKSSSQNLLPRSLSSCPPGPTLLSKTRAPAEHTFFLRYLKWSTARLLLYVFQF